VPLSVSVSHHLQDIVERNPFYRHDDEFNSCIQGLENGIFRLGPGINVTLKSKLPRALTASWIVL